MANETNNNNKTSRTSAPLKRLVIFLGALIGFVIYAYGWTVTDVDLGKPQDPQRQENVSNALGELLSPRLLEQEQEVEAIAAAFRFGCDAETEIPVIENDFGATITLEPNCGEEGDVLQVTISGFQPLANSRLRWVPPEGNSRPLEDLDTAREEITLNENGDFVGHITVPRLRASDGDIHTVELRALLPTGPVMPSDITGKVIQRMIETIFMALLATSVAIPIAGVISFFAARNLMQPISLLAGNMLVSFIGFAIGVVLGGVLLTPIGALGLSITEAPQLLNFLRSGFEDWPLVSALLVLVLGAVVTVAFAFALLFIFRRYIDFVARINARRNVKVGSSNQLWGKKAFDSLNTVVMALLIMLALGLMAGWLVYVSNELIFHGDLVRPEFVRALDLSREEVIPLAPGEWLQNAVADGFVAVGTFLNIIGTLVELIMPAIAGVVGGFVLAGIAGNLLSPILRAIKANLLSRALCAVLGAIAAAILMYVVAGMGLSATLFGLFPPFVAALLGGQVAVLLYNNGIYTFGLLSRDELFILEPAYIRYGRRVAFALGAVVLFVMVFNELNVTRSLVDGTLPSRDTISFLGLDIIKYQWTAILYGLGLGALVGYLSGLHASFPLGSALYNVSRTLLNTIRSIEPLIMGLVFVVWVGIGPFAGVLALTLHSIAALGKLYSEQIENIDPGPIEAIQSTGANRLQTIIYAVVPQIIPPYIAFTMYRWDINVRMSTIIGFVGGGGIGLLLNQQINLLRYRDAGVAVLAIAIVVSILDYVSATLRERLI